MDDESEKLKRMETWIQSLNLIEHGNESKFLRPIWIREDASISLKRIIERRSNNGLSAIFRDNFDSMFVFRDFGTFLAGDKKITVSAGSIEYRIGPSICVIQRTAKKDEAGVPEHMEHCREIYTQDISYYESLCEFNELVSEVLADALIQISDEPFFDPKINLLIARSAASDKCYMSPCGERGSVTPNQLVTMPWSDYLSDVNVDKEAATLIKVSLEIPYSLGRLVILCSAIEVLIGKSKDRKKFFEEGYGVGLAEECRAVFDVRNDGVHEGKLMVDYAKWCARAMKLIALILCHSYNRVDAEKKYFQIFPKETTS